jgi:sirohydrochlorin ferrochelatase
MATALLLIAHGSRNPEANADLYHVAEEMRRRGTYATVEASFLELVEPDILAAGRRCVDQGADRVILLPYFLSPGVHARQDLEEFRAKLAGKHPGARFLLAEPLGRHVLLIDLLTLRAKEAEAKR